MRNTNTPLKILFVESHEYGHVMLHFAAMKESVLWQENNIHLLSSSKVNEKLKNGLNLSEHELDNLIPENLIQYKCFRRIRQ